MDRLLHIRVEMHRVDKSYRWISKRQITQGMADLQEAITKILPAMAGNQHKTLGLPVKGQMLIQETGDCLATNRVILYTIQHPEQGINDCVSGYCNLIVFYLLSQ